MFSLRPMANAGKFAYSIYLVHFPVLAALLTLVPESDRYKGFHNVGYFLFFFIVVICSSYAFYVLFERPFVSNRERKIRPRACP